jgi:hypothetical protein
MRQNHQVLALLGLMTLAACADGGAGIELPTDGAGNGGMSAPNTGGAGGASGMGPATGGTSGGSGGAAGTNSGGSGGAAGMNSGGSGGAAGMNSGGSGGAAGMSSGGSGGAAGMSSGGSGGSGGSSGEGGESGEGGTVAPEPPPEYLPSPSNPPECPAVAPEDPVGDCLGLPVYVTCEYGDDNYWYVCTCDWYHWLCAGT